jgi:hypothetical protein
MSRAEGLRSLRARPLEVEIRDRLGVLRSRQAQVQTPGSRTSSANLLGGSRLRSAITNLGGPRWSSAVDGSPPSVISCTPPNAAPSGGPILMTTCSAPDHADNAEVADLNLPDPAATTESGRNVEGAMFRGGIPSSGCSQPTDPAVHGYGGQSSQGRRYNSRRSASWSDTALEAAVQAVDAGESIRGASRCFGILPTSLRDHIYGRSLGRKRGRQGVLCKHEEDQLVDYIVKMQSLGWPMTIGLVRLKVAEICQDRPNPFTHGIPG